MLGSFLLLGFWNLRETQGLVGRRAYSVANENDFSWRKRLAGYEGALMMMADRPWFGFGWNQPERVYDALYRPAKVDEGMAIQLNDYLMLGMTLGVPALFCFGVYLWLSLAGRLPIANGRWQMGEGERVNAICRAGALVLLVGFWFDGGLFKLATGATFWILLELGREEGVERGALERGAWSVK
jgi:O-antigen ligase